MESLRGSNAAIFRNYGCTGKFNLSMSSSSSSLSYSPTVSSLTGMPLTTYPIDSSLLSIRAPSSSSILI
ncbi:hypothetical protein HID58_074437 [Brassica napus]|uniref:Uncharacterized protein n=1 Tax=Brassica napus TaxID=3708 RepID=A0ABQ7YGW6_BRANA|nr:hypothetical protein HID58_074437 [Brassica napus]